MSRKEKRIARAVAHRAAMRCNDKRAKLLAVEIARTTPVLDKARNRAKLFKTTITSSLFALSGRAQVRSAKDIPQDLLAIIKEVSA
jgi:hypothetical protein